MWSWQLCFRSSLVCVCVCVKQLTKQWGTFSNSREQWMHSNKLPKHKHTHTHTSWSRTVQLSKQNHRAWRRDLFNNTLLSTMRMYKHLKKERMGFYSSKLDLSPVSVVRLKIQALRTEKHDLKPPFFTHFLGKKPNRCVTTVACESEL